MHPSTSDANINLTNQYFSEAPLSQQLPPNPDSNPTDPTPAGQNLPATPPDQNSSNPLDPTPEPSLADLIAKLTPIQQSAFHLIAANIKPAQVAPRIHVTPKTIYRWINHDVRFIAAYNVWRTQTLELAHARTLAMSGLALDTLESALKDGDRKVALKFAERLNLFKQRRPGPHTPGEVARHRARRDLIKRIDIANKARELKSSAFRDFRSSNTIYDLDDRIWILMVERINALQLETPEARQEREEIQWGDAEGDEDLTRIYQAIRYGTEPPTPFPNPTPPPDSNPQTPGSEKNQ